MGKENGEPTYQSLEGENVWKSKHKLCQSFKEMAE